MSDGTFASPQAAGRIRLTAVMPNYNHAVYLPNAIGAITAQLGQDDELIVIDDASLDDSAAVISRLAAADPRVRLLRNSANLGALVTLQRGLEAARGRCIYFAAADDEILPGFFEAALAVLDAHPRCALYCAEAVLRDGESGLVTGRRPMIRPLPRGGCVSAAQALDLFRKADNFILTGSSVFRRALLLEKGGFDAANGSFADGVLARKVAMTHGFYFDPRAAAIWNIFPAGLSRSTALDIEKARLALTDIPERLAHDRDFPEWYPALFERRWRFGAARLAIAAAPPDRDLVMVMGARTALDRLTLGAISHIGWLRLWRLLALLWISLRLRPFGLRGLILTAAARKLEALDRRG